MSFTRFDEVLADLYKYVTDPKHQLGTMVDMVFFDTSTSIFKIEARSSPACFVNYVTMWEYNVPGTDANARLVRAIDTVIQNKEFSDMLRAALPLVPNYESTTVYSSPNPGNMAAWLSMLPTSELYDVLMDAKRGMTHIPGIEFNWDEINWDELSDVDISGQVVNALMEGARNHPERANIIHTVHTAAMKRSRAYASHIHDAPHAVCGGPIDQVPNAQQPTAATTPTPTASASTKHVYRSLDEVEMWLRNIPTDELWVVLRDVEQHTPLVSEAWTKTDVTVTPHRMVTMFMNAIKAHSRGSAIIDTVHRTAMGCSPAYASYVSDYDVQRASVVDAAITAAAAAEAAAAVVSTPPTPMPTSTPTPTPTVPHIAEVRGLLLQRTPPNELDAVVDGISRNARIASEVAFGWDLFGKDITSVSKMTLFMNYIKDRRCSVGIVGTIHNIAMKCAPTYASHVRDLFPTWASGNDAATTPTPSLSASVPHCLTIIKWLSYMSIEELRYVWTQLSFTVKIEWSGIYAMCSPSVAIRAFELSIGDGPRKDEIIRKAHEIAFAYSFSYRGRVFADYPDSDQRAGFLPPRQEESAAAPPAERASIEPTASSPTTGDILAWLPVTPIETLKHILIKARSMLPTIDWDDVLRAPTSRGMVNVFKYHVSDREHKDSWVRYVHGLAMKHSNIYREHVDANMTTERKSALLPACWGGRSGTASPAERRREESVVAPPAKRSGVEREPTVSPPTTGDILRWLTLIPKGELGTVWTQMKLSIIGLDWVRLDNEFMFSRGIYIFLDLVKEAHLDRDDVVAVAHMIALEHSRSYKAHFVASNSQTAEGRTRPRLFPQTPEAAVEVARQLLQSIQSSPTPPLPPPEQSHPPRLFSSSSSSAVTTTVAETETAVVEIIDQRTSSDPPNEYLCPITGELMDDPVVAADGHSYERAAIEQWYEVGRRTSPKTNANIPTFLVPNIQLRTLIKEHRAKYKV